MIIVVCDDARTAPAYFNQVKQSVRSKLTLTVAGNRHGCAASDLVTDAKRRLLDLQAKNARDVADQTSAWVLIDLEDTPDCESAAWNAKKSGEAAGLRVALSKPCYEVWTLLHLVDTGELFNDCSAVIKRIGEVWQAKFGEQFERKAQADYGKIIEDRSIAAARAKQHCEARDPSWTEVYLVMADIEQRCQARPGVT